MALPRLVDIANGNVASYQNRFERKSDVEKCKVADLHENLDSSINMEIDALCKTLMSRYKNRFEICSARAGMSLEEFGKLPTEQQVDYICPHMKPENRVYGIRRVDFSNRYEDGLQLYYMAPYMGMSAGNLKYGRCCVIVNALSSAADVVLKYDSLTHYYNDENEFNEDACHKDLIPYDKVGLLLSDKYSGQLVTDPIDEIKRAVENDPDPIEIMTTKVINGARVSAVVVSSEDYKYIVFELNIKKARGELLDSKEEEDLQNFTRLQLELRRRGINLRIA